MTVVYGGVYQFPEGGGGFQEANSHQLQLQELRYVVTVPAISQQQRDELTQGVVWVEESGPEMVRILLVQVDCLLTFLDERHHPNLHKNTSVRAFTTRCVIGRRVQEFTGCCGL